MLNCRRLRACCKHFRGRVAVVLALLSLPGLVLFSYVLKDYNITRLVSSMRLERDDIIVQTTTAGQSVSASLLRGTELRPSLVAEVIPQSSVDANTTSIATKNTTKQEATIKDSNVKDESPTNKLTQNAVSPTTLNATKSPVVSKKFVFYVCDRKMYCYGLGDRQRGLSSVYLLAEVTNRTFGIIMTSPSNFTEFYKPNLVPWDIPASQLQGKSYVDLVMYGPKTDLRLHEIDFNKVYPQDIVYIRTNHKIQGAILKNPLYKDKLPSWATKVQAWQLFQASWLRLMVPTETLRQQLNEILVDIAQKMHDEYAVSEIFKNSKCCTENLLENVECVNSTCAGIEQHEACCNLTSSSKTTATLKTCSNGTCTFQTNNIDCSHVTCTETSTDNCSNKACSSTSIPTHAANTTNKTNGCVKILENKTTQIPDLFRIKPFAVKYCQETRPVLAPWASIESIRQSHGHDKVNLNLVCVHIRVGRSSTLPFEGAVRNRPDTVAVVWQFLKPYLAKGQHVYLATDSQEVRDQAKGLFGDRVHVSTVPIAHIAVVTKGQDERAAFSLTLVEQLLLATSCKVLVISYSGFSMKAAQIRHQLPGGDWELYIFKNGAVQAKGVKWLMR